MDTGTYRLSVNGKGVGCSYFPAGSTAPVRILPSNGVIQSIAYGTDTGQGNLISSFELTIDASDNATINMYDGSLYDIFRQPAAYRVLRSFFAWIISGGDDAGVTIEPAASNGNDLWWGTGSSKTIYPNGAPEIGGNPAGVTVDASHNGVKFVNNGAVPVVIGIMLSGSDT